MKNSANTGYVSRLAIMLIGILFLVAPGLKAIPPTPVPFIGSITPISVLPGGATFTLTVNGAGFASNAVVNYGGTALATLDVSATQLTAAVTSSLIANSGTGWITVTNPGTPTRTSNLMFLPVGTPTAALNYTSQSLSAVGSEPLGVAQGDFNGDGKLDLAVANASGTLAIFLGNADGTFQAATTYAVTAFPVGVAVGDLNGDGKLDLVVGNDDADTVSVFLGNGDGTFQAEALVTMGINDTDYVVLGDFNNDGNLDIAAAEDGGGSVDVALGNGDGTFQASASYPVGNDGFFIHEADLNGDGKLDLVVVGDESGGVSVLLGNGDGTFQAYQLLTAGPSTSEVTIADFNGDGKLDILGSSIADNNVYLLLGNGDGTFQSAQAEAVGGSSWLVASADLNEDGKMDLVLVANNGITGVALGNGDGTFQTEETFAGSNVAYGLVIGNFGTGGSLGIAMSDLSNNTVQVLEQTVSLSPSTLDFGSQPLSVATAAQDFTLTNSTDSTLHISAITFTGTNAGDFSDTTNCGNTLASTASCVIHVKFTPDAAGGLSGTLSVTDDAPGGVQTATLTGTGVSAPVITLAPTALSFSATAVGVASAAKSVTVTNNGSAILNITGIVVTGANSADFTATNTCTATLAVSGTCGINVTFTPSASGTRTAAVSITDDAASSPQVITLSGTGGTPDFSMEFTSGKVLPAGTSENLTLTVTPIGGFTGTVALKCSGAPELSTCTVKPASVTLNGSAAATSVFTLTTDVGTAAIPMQGVPPTKFPPAAIRFGMWLAALLMLAMAALGWKAPKGRSLRPAALSFGVLLLLVSVGMSACVGVTKHEALPTTPPGNYTLTATGTSGSLTHTATIGITISAPAN